MEPPVAVTPFTVSYALTVSYCQITVPSVVERARRIPSQPPVKKTPGMAVPAAVCPKGRGWPRASGPGGWNRVVHCRSPVESWTAAAPPVVSGDARRSAIRAVSRFELAKLLAQWPTRILPLACVLVPLAFAESSHLPKPGEKPGVSAPNRFYMYGVIGRLAMLAASYELEATDPEAEVYE